MKKVAISFFDGKEFRNAYGKGLIFLDFLQHIGYNDFIHITRKFVLCESL